MSKCWTISQHRSIKVGKRGLICEEKVRSEPISRSKVPARFNLAYYRTTGTYQASKMVIKTSDSAATMESKVGFKTVGIGASVRTTLVSALSEGRTVIGMANAIQQLREDPQQFVFCFMAPSEHDSGSHMQEVLLEAFCFEHDIYIIKVGL